jgi:hypothetical protein
MRNVKCKIEEKEELYLLFVSFVLFVVDNLLKVAEKVLFGVLFKLLRLGLEFELIIRRERFIFRR